MVTLHNYLNRILIFTIGCSQPAKTEIGNPYSEGGITKGFLTEPGSPQVGLSVKFLFCYAVKIEKAKLITGQIPLLPLTIWFCTNKKDEDIFVSLWTIHSTWSFTIDSLS